MRDQFLQFPAIMLMLISQGMAATTTPTPPTTPTLATFPEIEPITFVLQTFAPITAVLRPAYLDRLSFPAQEFFKVSNDETLFFDSMWRKFEFENFLDRRTCSGSHCAKRCRCDDRCMEDRTCCIDYLWNNLESKLNISTPISLDEYLTLLVKESNSYKAEECRPVLHHTPGHYASRINMIASCPKSTSESERRLCLAVGPSNDINYPVIGSDGYVYKNEYCAICNNIPTYKNLDISITCEHAQNMTDPGKSFSNFAGCLFDVIAPKEQPKSIKPCVNMYIRDCDISHPLYDLCRSYIGEIGGFANVHCLWCNNKTFGIFEPFNCVDGSLEFKTRSYSFVISFSGGTDFSYQNSGPVFIDRNGNIIEQAGTRKVCQPGETYDISQASCVEFQCAIGYEVSGSSCIKITNTIGRPFIETNSSFDNCLLHSGGNLLFHIGSRNSTTLLLANLSKIAAEIHNCSDNDMVSYIEDFPAFAVASSPLPSAAFYSVLSNLSSPEHTIWSSVHVIYVSSQSFRSFTSIYGPDLSRHYRNGICVESHFISPDSMRYNDTCTVEAFNSTFSLDYITQWIEIRPGSILKKLHLCTAFHLQSSCKLKTIASSNYTFENTSASIKLKDSNKTLKYTDYLPLRDGVGVCIESGKTSEVYLPTWLKDTNNVEYYLTMVGIPISIICYLWIILTYTLIRPLRNIPGCNISALCTALLLSDIVFLVIIEIRQSDTSCKIFAILFHWLLLQVQAWSAIIAIEVARRFGRTTHKASNSWSRFYIYIVLAMAFSTSVVVIMVSVDETVGGVGYGKGGLCWIADFYSRLFGYILLVAFVSLGAALLLGYVLLTIYKEHKQASKLLKKSGGEPISITKIALKLILLVGIVEIIGLVQITSPDTETEHAVNATFRILYTLLRSFRGVMIWLMYIATRVVWKHYKAHFEEFTTVSSKSTRVTMSQSSAANSMTELHKVSTPQPGEERQNQTTYGSPCDF